MAGKINEGDVIEGIFTIGLALFIVDGKVDKTKLNKIRTQIDTKLFNTGRFKMVVASAVTRKKGSRPPDIFNVGFEMRLKPESVVGAFGKDYDAIYYKSSNDIGHIDKKIDQLIKSIDYGSYSRRVTTIVNQFLDNNVGEVVDFTVIADGIAGESSGGAIKGDVSLDIYATAKGKTKKIHGGTIPFSLKSESVTVANLSPYRGMLDIAKALNIEWDAKTKYERLSKSFNGPTEQAAKFQMITSMYNDLKKEIIVKSTSQTFTKDALTFLGKGIFGDDLADVVDIQRGKVKEITTQYFKQIEKQAILYVVEKGNNLVFMDKQTQAPIFQIRTKLRPPPANEAKFYLEVGSGVYAH